MSAYAFRARAVFPVLSSPIADGVVTCHDGRITDVGQRPAEDCPLHELGDVALLPGLVNAHTHLEFSNLAKPLGRPGMSPPDWIRLVIAHRRGRRGQPRPEVAAGLDECLRSGVVAVGEISTGQTGDYLTTSARPHVTQFLEVIGFSTARAESAAHAARQRLDDAAPLFDTDATLGAGLSPHAPYSVAPKLLQRLVALANERDLPVAMHLAESTAEMELLAEGTGPFRELLEEASMWDPGTLPHGTRPREYLEMLAHAPRALVIHGNHLGDDDHAFLAEHRDHMTLVHCPRTHAFFGHPRFPLARLLARGVRVALGTDSRASSPDLSLLSEMRQLARVHPELSPTTILELGTLAPARALGIDDHFGAIASGRLAKMVAIPIPAGAGTSFEEILAAILADDNRDVLLVG